jgi:uncharacterized membrane protein
VISAMLMTGGRLFSSSSVRVPGGGTLGGGTLGGGGLRFTPPYVGERFGTWVGTWFGVVIVAIY